MSTTTIRESRRPAVVVVAEDDLDDRLLMKDAMAESKWSVDVRFVDNGEKMMEYLNQSGEYADVIHLQAHRL
jgi:hypothetical protein